MARVVWTPAALHDITRLYEFLAPKNREAARRAVRAIREGMKRLAAHPDIGRPVEPPHADLREWLVRFGNAGYVALYRHEGDIAVILAIRHMREAGYQSAPPD